MLAAKDIPNLISIGRIILVFPVVWLLLNQKFQEAMLLFFIAGASDALDGFLAKHYHWESRLGGILDPLADKFLLVSTYFCLGWVEALPWWLIGLIILRDLVIVGGALVYNYRIAQLEAEPTIISKVNTFLQIALALLVVYSLGFEPVNNTLVVALIWLVTASTLLSGYGYVTDWSRRARENGANGKQ